MCFSITKVFNTIKDKICAHNIYVESNKKTLFVALYIYVI